MIKLIVFDWDDVIVTGSKEGYFDCYHKAIKSVGIKLSPAEERQRVLSKWSKTNYEELKILLKENPQLLAKAYKNFEKIFWGDTFVKHQKIIKGSRKVLRDLSKHYQLAVASSGNKEMIEKMIIPHFNIPNVFKMILSSEQMPGPSKMKPHPMILKKIMNKLDIKPEETLYVGDSNTDIQMAHKAKVVSVAVLTGHLSRSEAVKEKSDYIINDITGMSKILRKLK